MADGDPRRPRGRDEALVEAIVAISDGLELDETLYRIVTIAAELVHARYGALGIHGEDGRLSSFVHVGMDDETIETIGPLPQGLGLLGVLEDAQAPIRLDRADLDPRAAGVPPGHPHMRTFLGVPIKIGREVFGNLYLTEKVNGTFTPEDEQVVEVLAVAAGVALANARLFRESEQQREWQRAVSIVDAMVLAQEPYEVVHQHVVAAARELSGAAASVLCVDTEQVSIAARSFHLASHAGPASQRWSPAYSRLTQHDRTELMSEFYQVGDLVQASDILAECIATGQVCHGTATGIHPLLDECVAVPLIAAGEVMGALGLYRLEHEEPFHPRDIELALSFGAQVATAYYFGEESRERERLVLFEERDRIARDLHDLVIQRLYATGMMLHGVMRFAELPPALQDRISTAVDELDGTIKEIRTTIFDLTDVPEEPSWVSVRARVLAEVERAAVGHRRRPSVTFHGPVDHTVDADLAGHLVAAVRESLSNAIRHGECSEIYITVTAAPDHLRLVVEDDGVGFPAYGQLRMSGLKNLQERAQDLGGDCVVSNRPRSQGARVEWWVAIEE